MKNEILSIQVTYYGCMERKNLVAVGLLIGVFGLVFAVLAYSFLASKNSVDPQSVVSEVEDISVVRVEEQEVSYIIDESDYLDSADFVNTTTNSEITETEKKGLLLMREEEKLARDVYTTLGDAWGVRVFTNIAASEQTHMNVMGDLLKTYGIADPIVNETVGVFTNPDLQKLYNDLTKRGLSSIAEAFQVGALIEDLDIYDLEKLLTETNKEDIVSAYKNLQKGSRNHMRAFTKQIEKAGGVYVPQYISASEYQEIIGTAQERGRI